jgi:hypothetical protein
LKLSVQLIDLVKQIPLELFDHPYVKHPISDRVGVYHDFLVAQNSTPEQVAELMKRGMFCGVAHIQKAEARRLKCELDELRGPMRRMWIVVVAWRLVRRVIKRVQRPLQRGRPVFRHALHQYNDARYKAWKRRGNG